ncbi:MAG: zinc ribbon domain-containing protein [Acidobacteriota bacterium]|nr:zinc ribbon domain-containing protein [Acidobacteriota bacterium]
MFCPRCSQQQVTEETKFCSRCGFPLVLVSEILAHGGFLPQLADVYKSKKLLTRRNGLLFSLFWFLIITMIITPLAAIIGTSDEFVGFMGLIGSVGAFIMMLASFLILEKESRRLDSPNRELPAHNIHNLHATQPPTALPPPYSQPANNYVPPPGAWKAPNTDDFAPRGSVTEGTTKLLDSEK